MRLKPLLLVLTASVVLLLLLLMHVHIQPGQQGRILRRGEQLRVLYDRIGWEPRYRGSSCLVRLVSGAPFFDQTRRVPASELDYTLQVRFGYRPPKRLTAGWGSGDWCSALSRRVFDEAARWLEKASMDEIVEKPRETALAAANHIEGALERDGLAVSNLTVRFRLPESLNALRSVPEVVRRAEKRPPVIFVGLDGADWELLDRYIATGVMPNLAALVREGHGGVLLTEHPPLSPLLWATMMTGVNPLEHQILDFTRFHPESRVKEPITSDERRVPAVWNIATYGGKSVASMGLWATYPAEPVRGLMVSDRLFTFLYTEATPPPHIVFPEGRENWARETLKKAEERIGYDQLKEYLSSLSEAEYRRRLSSANPYAHPITALRRILVETSVYHELASSYLETHTPDLTLLYLQGTDTIGHVFAPFNPPRQPQVSEADFSRYQGVAERYFRYVDKLLGEYRDLAASKNGVLMLASDHGFRWFEGRPAQLSSYAAATAAKWHRNEGMYLLWGNGIQPSRSHTSRGGIAQVATTLLSLIGLPPGEGLQGPALPGGGPATGSAIDYQRYYKPVRSALPGVGKATEEELAKLRALGYIGAGESVTAPASEPSGTTRTAGSYNNEGLILRDQKRAVEAIAAFEKAISLDPNLASALWNLSDTLFERKRDLDRSDELLVRALANGLPEGLKYVVGRAIGYQRGGELPRSLALLEQAVRARPDEKELRLFRGRYRIDRGNCAGALEDFVVVQQIAPSDPVAYASAGLAAVCMGDRAAAATNFRRSLQIDPNQPRLRVFLQQLSQ